MLKVLLKDVENRFYKVDINSSVSIKFYLPIRYSKKIVTFASANKIPKEKNRYDLERNNGVHATKRAA